MFLHLTVSIVDLAACGGGVFLEYIASIANNSKDKSRHTHLPRLEIKAVEGNPARDSVDICSYVDAAQRSRIDVKLKSDFLFRIFLDEEILCCRTNPGLGPFQGNCILGFSRRSSS
jgi:hypothetical protein